MLGAGFAAPVRPARYYSTAAGISDAKADTAHANVIPPAMGRVDIRNVSIKPKSPQKAKNNKKEAQNATKKTPVRVRGVAPRVRCQCPVFVLNGRRTEGNTETRFSEAKSIDGSCPEDGSGERESDITDDKGAAAET